MSNLKTRRPAKQVTKHSGGVSREDSDDELGTEDHPWEWIYEEDAFTATNDDDEASRKRKRPNPKEILGARMGNFTCKLGDTVLLKAEESNEAWVGIICDFLVDDEDGEKAARFLWFSSEKEIANKEKKRTDFHPVSQIPTP
jgi:origin recognition complex subunit 1